MSKLERDLQTVQAEFKRVKQLISGSEAIIACMGSLKDSGPCPTRAIDFEIVRARERLAEYKVEYEALQLAVTGLQDLKAKGASDLYEKMADK